MTAPARVSAGDQGFKAQLGTLALPVGILCMLAMMIVPLPVALLDIFFVGNILLSLLVLMVAINSQRPLDFSSFPSLLLIGTVLRLALNVASTRVVLGEGHTGHGAAGQVIQAFGDFVIAGNFVVGFLVFAILVIINLVVLTKGAGRVSEVSARFTLDAMPGKQMAIDADLNAGLMTPDEAKARRIEVAAEADFYGSMDGASKFVKGDAVAGILILAINVIGGVLIGTLQHGLTLNEAASTYVLLAIGDGLVAQIPALLLSIATAIIVTRAAAASNMGALIGKQVNMPDAWMPVAGVLLTLGLVPGMPNLILLTAAAIAGGFGWSSRRKLDGEAAAAAGAKGGAAPAAKGGGAAPGKASSGGAASQDAITPEEVSDHAPLSLQIGYGLIPLAGDGGGVLVPRITAIRREISRAMGFVVPGVRIRDDLTLGPNQYRIRIGQTIMGEDVVYPDRKLAIPGAGSTRKLKGVNVKDPSFGLDAVWILPHQQVEAEADDHMVIEPEAVIATHLGQVLQKHAGDLIGPDEVQALLDTLAKAAPTLVQSVVPKLVPLHVVTSVLRCLLNERVPISDMRKILEGLALVSGRTQNPQEMAEALRPALVPLLLQQLVPVTAPLPLITLEPDLEQMLMRARRPAPDEGLVIDGGLAGTMVRSLSQTLEAASGRGQRPVVIVAQALRRSFAAFLRPHLSDAVVLGIHELPEARRIEVIAAIGGPSALPGQKEG
ncbi:flagellar biosynthesis protein FlhA [Gemmobacter lanyuensis]|uniref:Flagellar biosynthesis protein FlhA n=1 Tax=Gemmobacter lanyuensis TaxID=1054497 RepID=A0A918IKX8_9RHOB|nr:flagellar biosynthesis protein FlhA [Gemmobacter lanyuensis]GGW21482.1 flagellar biosynthesis protein FlhA [Gemmobacter lanyuensis]